MAQVLMIVAPKDFRDEEYYEPRQVLEQSGHTIVVASTLIGELKGSRGGVSNSGILLESADPNNFDAIVFVGGFPVYA